MPEGDRLAQLLAIERRLEERIREAERAARARVEQARKALESAGRDEEIERLAREQEREDLEQHASELRRIEQERAATIARLSELTDDTIEALARKVYARVAGSDRNGGAR